MLIQRFIESYKVKNGVNLRYSSELVLLEQNIGTSGGDSTSPESKSLNLPLIEEGVL